MKDNGLSMADESVNELLRKYKETGNERYRNEFAEKHLYIAEILAKKFVGRGVPYDDLYQEAALSLLRGIERFDPDKGLQFSTFITPTITGELKNYFRDKFRLVKPPRRSIASASASASPNALSISSSMLPPTASPGATSPRKAMTWT